MRLLDENTKIIVHPSTPIPSPNGSARESPDRQSSTQHLTVSQSNNFGYKSSKSAWYDDDISYLTADSWESNESAEFIEDRKGKKPELQLRPSTPITFERKERPGAGKIKERSVSANHLVPESLQSSSRRSRSSRSYGAWSDDISYRTGYSWETIDSSDLTESGRRKRLWYKCKCFEKQGKKLLIAALALIGIVTISIVVTSSLETSVAIDIDCKFSHFVGDGKCDDISNVETCNYDGGDCCRNNATAGTCCQCKCHTTKEVLPSNVCATTSTIPKIPTQPTSVKTTTQIQTVSTTKSTSSSSTTTTFHNNPCDDGWFLINGIKCIFVSGSSPAVFEGAEFECLIKGGRLLEPRELSFESEIHNHLETSKVYWLGITDRTEEGK